MIGTNKDKEFDQFGLENYEEFYAHHQFVETKDGDAENVHEIVPRFGWGFDVVEEFQPKNLLDIGTLDGSFPITIARHFGIPVTGIDLTVDGIELAKKRAKALGLDAEFYQGYAEEILEQFIKEGRKFDLITAFEIIEHVKDTKVFLSLIDKLLAPGGNVLLSTPDFESPLYGKDDEKNKCHIRLYTTADDDYEAVNKYGNVRKATSMSKEIGSDRIKEMGVYSHLINCRYQ
ncbi:capping protein [Caudoviricetes sp.]|nr:capping protein [Caudoviricetes sp.]